MVLLLRDSRFTWRRTKKQELLLLAFAKGTCGSSSHRKDAMSMTWTITASFAYATSKSSSLLLSFVTLVFCSSLLYRIVFHTKSMVIAGKFDFRFWLEVCFFFVVEKLISWFWLKILIFSALAKIFDFVVLAEKRICCFSGLKILWLRFWREYSSSRLWRKF